MPNELVARNGLIALNNSFVTGSLNVTSGITGSLFGTSSWAIQALTASSADNFSVRGTLTATTLVVQTITSSQNFITGSTRFGTIITNTHQFTGSVGVTGSITVINGVTNNLTASWSNRAISASIADNAVTASRALNANTASHAAFAATATSATTATSVVATVTGTNSAELVRGNMADNDQFRILVGGTSTNAGYAEIATADDGTEPIHVRQYTGVFSSLTRTATLLDGSGNTSFPGNVGIGSTSPARKLDVNGTSIFRDFTTVVSSNGNPVSNTTWLSTDSGITNIYTGGTSTVQLNSSGVSYFNGGNVGIGTTSPGYRLHVKSNTSGGGLALERSGNAADTVIRFKNEASADRAKILFGGTNEELAFYAGDGNTANMFIASGGNVGIGTTSPTTLIHAYAGASGATRDNGTYTQLVIEDNGDAGIHVVNPNANIGRLMFGTPSNQFGGLIRWDYTNNNFDFGTDKSGGYIRFLTDAFSEKMRITSGGNVGIGTTSPDAVLAVHGQFRIRTTNGDGNENRLLFNPGGAGDPAQLYLYNEAQSNTIYVTANGASYFNAGSVGIGTTSPSKKLHVRSGDNEGMFMEGSSNGGHWFDFKSANSNLWSMGAQPGIMGWYNRTDNSYKMVISDGGNVGIGTTSPTGTYGKLTVAGGILILDDNNAKLEIGRYSSGASNSYIKLGANSNSLRVTNKNDTADIFTIENGGNVGIGTTSPSGKLDISGGQYNTGLIVRSGDVNGTGVAILNTDTGGHNWYIISTASSNGGGAGNLGFYDGTNGNYLMYIKGSNGNVGIGGTTSPEGKLHVYASAVRNMLGVSTIALPTSGDEEGVFVVKTNSALWQQSIVGYAVDSKGLRVYNTGGSTYTSFEVANGSGTRLIVAGSGNVGIGTTSPINLLDVYQSVNGFSGINTRNPSAGTAAHSGLYIGNDIGTNSGGMIVFGSGATYSSPYNPNGTYIYSNRAGGIAINSEASAPLYLATNNTIRLYITSGGNVGIGTTSPITKLALGGYNGARLAYVNGTGNTFDANGITVPSSNTNNAGIGGGIDLTNNTYSVGAYSPLISFSSLSSNSAYNNAYAGIWGVLSGQGVDANWVVGHLAFGTGGGAGITERMRITSGGSVGIGTTSPSEKLHIAGNTYIEGTGNALYFDTDASGKSITQYVANLYEFHILNARGNSSRFILGNSSISLGTSASPQFYINTSNGNVGIGTTSPSQKLDIQGNIYANGDIRSQGIFRDYQGEALLQTNTSAVTLLGTTGASTSRTLAFLAGNAEHMRITTGGNVGIGTTSPNGKMTVVGNTVDIRNGAGGYGTGYALEFSTNANIPRIDWIDNGAYTGNIKSVSGEFVINNSSNNALLFNTNNTERMRITSGGNVGIGTTSVAAKLQVHSTIATADAPTIFLNQYDAGSQNYANIATGDMYHGVILRGYPAAYNTYGVTTGNYMSFYEYGGDFRFYKKDVSSLVLQGYLNGGTWTVTGDVVAYGSPSDINLKENIKPLEGALEKVMKLQGVSFTWKEDTDTNKVTGIKDDIGFIAQEVQEILPDLVRKNDNGLLSLRDKGITALLVEAIKEQQKQIDELKYLLQNK